VTLSLRAPAPEELSAWRRTSHETYVAERIAAGESPEVAARVAAEQSEALFPGGSPAEGQHVFRLQVGDEPVGWLWLGRAPEPAPDAWWVYDLQVDPAHRGRGHGRAAMLLAEREARTRGGRELGLHVFGRNTVARRLYESLGYRTDSVRMSKPLR
jgi:ribosomal protein S18 acetylase RimI-like enzyme